MQASITAVIASNILQLAISLPAEAFEAVQQLDGHTPVAVAHVTLVRLDDLGLSPAVAPLPAPPVLVEFDPQVRLVDTGVKQATYVVCSPTAQLQLADYTKSCLLAMGLPEDCLDPQRVFHATLSNIGGGDVRASVGSPWEYPFKLI